MKLKHLDNQLFNPGLVATMKPHSLKHAAESHKKYQKFQIKSSVKKKKVALKGM